ncbi:MAG: glycosyltransferase [Bacteroidota bacterium]
MPRVSVVIGASLAHEALAPCLDDLFTQSLYRAGSVEVIVAHPEREADVPPSIQLLRDANPALRLVTVPGDATMGARWNHALEQAHAPYVMLLRVEDRLRPDALDRLATYLVDHHEVDVVYADQLLTAKPEEVYHNTTSSYRWNLPAYRAELMERGPILGTQPLWRRALYTAHGPFSTNYAELPDYAFWLRVGEDATYARYPDILGLCLLHATRLAGLDRDIQAIQHAHGLEPVTQAYFMNPVEVTTDELSALQAIAFSALEGPADLAATAQVFNGFVEAHRFEEAVAHCLRALSLTPQEPYLWVLLAMARRLSGQPIKAIEALKHSLRLGETPDALFEMLQLSLDTGNMEEAHETAQVLKRTYPEWTAQALQVYDEMAAANPTIIAKSA